MKNTQKIKYMPYKGRKKFWITLVTVLVVLVLAVDLFAANYLVSFAVGRATSGGASVAPEPSTTDSTRSLVAENTEKIAADTQRWREQATAEPVEITALDGLHLVGDLFVTDVNSHRWVILVHGYTSKRAAMLNYGAMYAKAGYNLLLPDMRGHGESEGEYIGMGWPDRKDLLQWIDLICSRDPNAQIVLHGVSMGGATVLMTSGEAMPENVQAVVSDCAYTSVWDIFADELQVLFGLPEFPLMPTASLLCKLRAGYDFTEASALEQVKKSSVPILFIHGAEDNFVHTDMVYTLYDACPGKKDLLVMENAGHGQSYSYAPDTYREKVFGFLAEVLE